MHVFFWKEIGLFCFATEIDLLGEIDLSIEKRNEVVRDGDVYRLTRVGEADLWWLLWWLKKVDDGEEKLELVEEAKAEDEEEVEVVFDEQNLPEGERDRRTGPLDLVLDDVFIF